MIKGIGNDIIEVARFKKALDRHKQKLLDFLFTKKEQEYCKKHKNNEMHFAARFSIKESISKCNNIAARVQADAQIPVETMNEDDIAVYWHNINIHMKTFEEEYAKVEKLLGDAIEDLNHLLKGEKIQLGIKAAVEKIEEEGLAKIEEARVQFEVVHHKLEGFFSKGAA